MKRLLALASLLALAPGVPPALAAEDSRVEAWCRETAKTCERIFTHALETGELKPADLFDRMYVPVPGTNPPKFHTRFDAFTDRQILPVLDGALTHDPDLVFVVLVDNNGYLPTHNTKFSKPLTGDRDKDLKGNRTKRIFNDRTGLNAARNTDPTLLQVYYRDNGEKMKDLSVPVLVKGRHWGAIRYGYR